MRSHRERPGAFWQRSISHHHWHFACRRQQRQRPAQDQIETVWTGSIIQMSNGDWLQFAGMDWNSRNSPRLARPLLSRRRVERAQGEAQSASICWTWQHESASVRKIILGFLGGTFKDKEGTLVQVKSLERSNGKLSHVKYALVDDDGTELVEEPAATMFKFTSKFGTPLGEPADAGVDDFDFAKYPLLLNILRASKLLEESATLMSRSDAAGFLTGMRAREDCVDSLATDRPIEFEYCLRAACQGQHAVMALGHPCLAQRPRQGRSMSQRTIDLVGLCSPIQGASASDPWIGLLPHSQ